MWGRVLFGWMLKAFGDVRISNQDAHVKRSAQQLPQVDDDGVQHLIIATLVNVLQEQRALLAIGNIGELLVNAGTNHWNPRNQLMDF